MSTRAKVLLLLSTVLSAVAVGLAVRPAEAVPVPVPVYQIRAVSNGHTATIAGTLTPLGAPQVPVPVDVDGDLLPDVAVSVNLVDAAPLLDLSGQIGQVLAPNVEIDRLLTAPVLGQAAPPLRIEVVLTVKDAGGGSPDTVVRFGYDTGTGGSIPPAFKAVLGGLDHFFNPLTAVVDTGPGENRPVTYDGPLRLVGGVSTGGTDIDMGFGYSPFPDQVRVSYLTDAAGQHVSYRHSDAGSVDLDAHLGLAAPDGTTTVDARVDRLPAAMDVDIADAPVGAGGITYHSSSDGRRPDVDVALSSIPTDPALAPLLADIDLESLPSTLSATWSLPEAGPTSLVFDADGQGIGAAEVDIRDHRADASGALARFASLDRQYVDVRQHPAPDGSTRQRISARVERIRHFSLDDDGHVLTAHAQLGDGEQPLHLTYDCSVACSDDGSMQAMAVDATVAPLPDDFSATVTQAGEDGVAEPMVLTYDASQPADVEATMRLVGATGTATSACGDVGTTCADLSLRDLPTHLGATIAQGEHRDGDVVTDSTMAVDLELGDGTLAPDLEGTVTIGASEPGSRPTVAEVHALHLPSDAHVLVHQVLDPDTGLLKVDRALFDACGADDAEDCAPGTGIGDLRVAVRNHLTAPAGFPLAPTPDAPTYATVTQRGEDLALEARFTDLRRVSLVDNGSILGVRTDIGDGTQPFAVDLDIQGSPLGDGYEIGDDGDPAQIVLDDAQQDLSALARVENLPARFELCMRNPHTELVATGESFTTTCEQNAFDEGDQPLAIAYDLGAPAKVEGSFRRTVRGTRHVTNPGVPAAPYEESFGGQVDLPTLPAQVSAQVLLPPEGAEGPMRAVYDASQVIPSATLGIESTVGVDAVCLDPRDPVTAMCMHATVAHLPPHLELRYDPTATDDNLEFHARGKLVDGVALPLLVHPDLTTLELSTVAPDEETLEQRALVLRGSIGGLPLHVHGTLALPASPDEPTAVQFCASAFPCSPDAPIAGEIGSVVVDATNILAADPTPLADDDPTNDMPHQRENLADPTQQLVMYQRGEAFHARVALAGIRGAGYRTVTNEDGTPSGTQVVNLDLDTDDDPVLRAFIDLDAGTKHIIGDATLTGLPRSTFMCFRGADLDPDSDPAMDSAPFCETRPTDDEGAFELSTDPGPSPLGVDAFFRQSTGGDFDVLAARVRIADVPPLVRGTYPAQGAGSLDVRSYADEEGTVPQGFGAIDAEVASFDLRAGDAGDGYLVDDTPFSRTFPEDSDMRAPAPVGDHQHLALVMGRGAFDARARVYGLQQIALRDDACGAAAADPGAQRFDDRPDHPTYPEPIAPGDHPYTCLRTVLEDGGGEPMDVFVSVDTNQPDSPREVLQLTDAQLTAVPSAMELIMAQRPTISTQTLDRPEACPVVGDGVAPAFDCMPAMIRFDQVGGGQLLGRVKFGRLDDIETAEAIQPDGNDYDEAAFAGIHDLPADTGVRAVVSLTKDDPDDEDEEARVAAVGTFRFDIPSRLTIDTPFSDGSDGALNSWSDFRFHYAVRDAAGAVVPSLGDMLVVLHQPDGSEVLLSGDGETGAPVPGELALAMYMRNDGTDGQQFIQIDGVTSIDMDLSAVILTPHETGLDPEQAAVLNVDPTLALVDRKGFQLRNLPSGPFQGWSNPSFRAQIQLIDNPYLPPGPYGAGQEDDDDCSAIDCVAAYIRVKNIRASLDMDPADRDPSLGRARLLRVAFDVRHDPTGEFRALDDVNAELGAPGNAEISATANISIDPVKLYAFKGIPFLGNIEADIDLHIELGLTLDRISSFLFGQNAMHLETESTGSGTNSFLGPIHIYPRTLFAGVQGPLNVTVAGIEFTGDIIPGDNELTLDYTSCDAGSLVLNEMTPIGAEIDAVQGFLGLLDVEQTGVPLTGNTNVVILPDFGPANFIPYGAGAIVNDLVEPLVHVIACAATDIDLQPLLNAEIPSDPMGIQGRRVPPDGDGDPTAVAPPPPPAPPTLQNMTLDGSQGAMCGLHEYDTLIISGLVPVAGAAGPLCPAGSESSLRLSARNLIITDTGSIDASGIVTGDCDPDSTNYRYSPTHNPYFGISDATCAAYLASNDGAAHVQRGGRGALSSFFSDGPPVFGGAFFFVNSDGGPSEAGWRGGGATGGYGGGVIGLSAERIDIAGSLRADGAPGGAGVDACSGGGGGSGGAVLVDAPYVVFEPTAQISADGGDGGPGGGGASSGGVLLTAGTLAGYANQAHAIEGDPGGSCGALSPSDAEPGVRTITTGRTQLLGLGDFWQTDYTADGPDDNTARDQVGIDLPFYGAVHDDGAPFAAQTAKPVYVVLCDIELDVTALGQNQLLHTLYPNSDPDWWNEPCGETAIGPTHGAYSQQVGDPVLVPPGTAQVFAANPMRFEDVVLGTGIHGLFTRAFTSDVPQNDCFDLDYYGDPANPTEVESLDDGTVLLARQFDQLTCRPAEGFPSAGEGSPELIIGVDDSSPQVEIQAVLDIVDPPSAQVPYPHAYTPRQDVRFTINSEDRVDDVRLSGIDSVVCYLESPASPFPEDVNHAVDCSGPEPWDANVLEGEHNVVVRATDAVGNYSEARIRVTEDEFGPSVDISQIPFPGTELANGWLSHAPGVRIDNFQDSGSGAADHPFAFQVDDGDMHPCQVEEGSGPDSCLVDLGDIEGRHLVRGFGIDRAGNYTGVGDFFTNDADYQGPGAITVVRVDRSDPTSGAYAAPQQPNGANGWWNVAPWVGVVGFDRPVGGAGFEPVGDDPTPNPEVAFLKVSVDGGEFTVYDRPFRLEDGEHTICTIARDLAGNPVGPPEQVCTPNPIHVDTTPPLAIIATLPGGPDGSGGWYTTPPAVGVSAFDGFGTGSGIDPDLAPSGLFVSVDDGPYALTPSGTSLSFGEGEHEVRAYAVDVAGNRSPVVARVVRIDTSVPASSIRTFPPAPANADGWFRVRPTVVLGATDGDQNAGVRALEYRLGTSGPFTTYTGPFLAPDGVTTVQWRALDASGPVNDGPIHSQQLKVDIQVPVAAATNPSAVIWSRLLGPSTVKLRFAASDPAPASGIASVEVVIYDALGNPVRRISAAPGATEVVWDGKGSGLALLPLGVYHYRVVVTDHAGHVAESGESRTITIKLL